jgi:hypothetical protein
MSQTTPDPVSGSNDPFRPDDEARDESRQGDDEGVGIGYPILNLDPDQGADRDEPGDRA